jgi:cell division protein FtsA
VKSIVGLDIGTSKIVALVAEIDNYGDTHIVGIGEAKSQGIDKGSVTKLDSASKAIQKALKEAEEMSGHRIDGVFISISGVHIKSQNERDTISISPQPSDVDEQIVKRLLERAVAKAKEESYDILHTIPRNFILDDQEGILDPIGLTGSRLECDVHIIKAGISLLRNVERTVSVAGYKLFGRVFAGLASAESSLTEEEKLEGVLLIDIGHSVTNFVLYQNGQPAVSGTVPIGGYNITRDLAHFLKISTEEAERIKLESGVAFIELVDEIEKVKIKPRGEDKEAMVPRRQLAEVIQIRLEELMDKIVEKINNSSIKLENINAGAVITGGTAKLNGIKDFTELYLDMAVRIGYPLNITGLKEKLQDPSYACVCGIIKIAQNMKDISYTAPQRPIQRQIQSRNTSFLQKIMNFFKDLI